MRSRGWLLGAMALAIGAVVGLAPTSSAGVDDGFVRARLDLSDAVDATTVYERDAAAPGDLGDGIGPGSPLVIEIPGAGTFGCTANYVWQSGSQRYLGAAGHCFLGDPEDEVGSAAELNGVVVDVCVAECYFGGVSSQLISGRMVRLGDVVYARQARGDEDLGEDFGLVAIPPELAELVRPTMPTWGGPTGVAEVGAGDGICSYGNGLVVGETFATKARTGVGAATDRDAGAWYGTYPANLGDSGSAVNLCDLGTGTAGIGVLTHLTVGFDGGPITTGGTTVAKAVQLAREGGLSICLVLDTGSCTGDSAPTVNEPPAASFTFGCTGTACRFDGTGSSDRDGTVSQYRWDFGDGGSATGPQAEHTFDPRSRKKVTYRVRLTVVDDDGAGDTAQRQVTCTRSGSGTTCA